MAHDLCKANSTIPCDMQTKTVNINYSNFWVQMKKKFEQPAGGASVLTKEQVNYICSHLHHSCRGTLKISKKASLFISHNSTTR